MLPQAVSQDMNVINALRADFINSLNADMANGMSYTEAYEKNKSIC